MRSNNAAHYSKKLLKILLLSVLVLLVAHFCLQALNWLVHYQQVGSIYELTNRFDLDDEASVPTWFSQFLFFLIGLSALAAAYLEKNNYLKRIWQIIGVVGLVFSVDEVAGLHEFALQTIHNEFYRDQSPTDSANAWLVVLPFILLAIGYMGIKTVRLLPRRTSVLFASSIAVFLLGAIAVDLTTSLVERETFLHQGLLVGLEEALELLGAIVFLYAIADYIERQHKGLIRNFTTQVKNTKPSSKS